MEENNIGNKNQNNSDEKKNGFSRRSILKGLATLPVVGLFGYEYFRDSLAKQKTKVDVLNQLGFTKESPAIIPKENLGEKSELIRFGIIGPGPRGMSLLESAGYRTQKDIDKVTNKNIDELKSWVKQDDLNVQFNGVCDVFDLHADKALEASTHSRSAYANSTTISPTKRFKHYKDLLDSKDIDAVIIATPDHHHAQMTIDAIQAGKHVYLEKSLTNTEEEVYEVEKVVKSSDRVFQMGHQFRHSPIFKNAKKLVFQNILGPVTFIETTTNRNTASGAWIRHLESDGTLKPGSLSTIDWAQWLGDTPKVPFSLDRYYGWTKWLDYGNGPWGQLFSHEYDAVNGLLDLGIPKYCNASGSINYWKDKRETPDTFNAAWEYPEQDKTLLYSLSLASSKKRGRLIMGRDATMELGGSLIITADANSNRYKKYIDSGIINPSTPFVSEGPDAVDGVTSATAKYYAERGLSKTTYEGEEVDLTYSHIKDWLNVIRYGGETLCGINVSVDEMITILMATKSYKENRRVEWDPIHRRII